MSIYYNGNEVSEVVYGTGDTGKLNFKAIGYEDVPEPLKDGLEYAKEIKDVIWQQVKNNSRAFANNNRLVFFPDVDFSMTTITDLSYWFSDCRNLITLPELNNGRNRNLSYCFSGCSSLCNIKGLNTSKVTNMGRCFQNCSSLTEIPELDTTNVTDMSYCFYKCSSLTTIPELDTSNVTSLNSSFSGCSSLTTIPQLNTSKVINMINCFDGCESLTEIPQLDTSKVTNMGYCFQNCSSLTEIPELDTTNATNFSRFVNISNSTNLKRINGISFKSMPSHTSAGLITYYTNESCRYVLIKDIGTQSGCTKLVINELRCWGINSDEVPDARQSLIDSLLTYSFDRASAGYSNCTIQLYKDVVAVLTEEELTAIQAKGYVITT